ncbi:MAG: two-component system response regulator OmpR, partial [Gammaproteobacteria bacterium]|nr:two-component system response regulator OmpR [Gammaproteobacteria bacterium]
MILIIDDDLGIQKLLTQYLSEQGYNALAIADGNAMD